MPGRKAESPFLVHAPERRFCPWQAPVCSHRENPWIHTSPQRPVLKTLPGADHTIRPWYSAPYAFPAGTTSLCGKNKKTPRVGPMPHCRGRCSQQPLLSLTHVRTRYDQCTTGPAPSPRRCQHLRLQDTREPIVALVVPGDTGGPRFLPGA